MAKIRMEIQEVISKYVNIIDDDITEERFVTAVCNAFKGDVKPAVCGPAAAA